MHFRGSDKVTNSRYCSFMKEPRLRLHKLNFCFDVLLTVPADHTPHLRVWPLVFLVAGTLTAMSAQTSASRTSGIQNHSHKAAEYLKANDPQSAIKEFNAVLALDPKNAEAYANLGVIAFFQRDYQNASRYLRKAATIRSEEHTSELQSL